MTVDIKTLTIGSHVLVDGRRVRVVLVRDDGCICEYNDNGQDVIVGLGVEKKPILITSALLEELGFEWRNEIHRWMMKCGETASLFVEENRGLGYFVDVHSLRYDWRNPLLCVKYLHELEGQLAYYGTELIKE